MIHEASHLELGSWLRNLVWINPFLVIICYSHSAHTPVHALHITRYNIYYYVLYADMYMLECLTIIMESLQ